MWKQLIKSLKKTTLSLSYGYTTIEIPQNVTLADEIAKEAQFFFGTNDLTQMTFGFSRDDAELSHHYYKRKIYEQDPFQKFDQVGVGN